MISRRLPVRIGDELFVEHRQYDSRTHHIFLAAHIRLGDLVHRKGGAVPVGGAPQQIVAGDAVEVGALDQEAQSALPDPIFVVGEQRLGDPQFSRGLFLADILFFAQQSDHTGKLGFHGAASSSG